MTSTRSTGTVHTSAKARLISVMLRIRIRIRIRVRDPDRHQNLIICSLAHWQPSLKIPCKSVWKFSCKVANRQTDKQRRLHILFGGGNNMSSSENKAYLPQRFPVKQCPSATRLARFSQTVEMRQVNLISVQQAC